jgi:DNA-binding MarR family transcriptional regulator
MKSKTELTSEVMELFQALAHSRMHYQFKPWQHLHVPLAQLKSLFLIHIKGSVSVRDLAFDLGVTPGNVTSIIDRLVGQGLVTRRENPEDRRIVLLHLTDKGRKIITDIHEISHSHMKHSLERMSAEDIMALLRGIRAFLAAIEKDYQELSLKQNENKGRSDISSPPPAHSHHFHTMKSS